MCADAPATISGIDAEAMEEAFGNCVFSHNATIYFMKLIAFPPLVAKKSPFGHDPRAI
jgi:hypothetical protein